MGANELIALDIIGYDLVASPPIVESIGRTGNVFTFDFTAVPGQTYQAQYSTDMAGNSWNNLGGPITATDVTMVVSDTNASVSGRLYRVYAISQPSAPAAARNQPQSVAEPSAPTLNTGFLLPAPQ